MNEQTDTITEHCDGDSTINVTYSNIEKILENCENKASVNSSNYDSSPKQTQSLFSEQSTPVRRASDIMTKDRFNEHKTSCIKSDNLSDLSIPSCLWLPHGPILNQGPIIKSPFVHQQENNEPPNRKQTSLSHHSEMYDKANTEVQISSCNTTELTGFSEFVSNGEAVERERCINDKFNGIYIV